MSSTIRKPRVTLNYTQDSTNSLSHYTPPHEEDAEKALLGILLISPKQIDEIADKIKAEYFYDPKNGVVFQAIIDLWSSHKVVDLISTADALSKNPSSELVTKQYLVELVSKSSLSASSLSLCSIIKDKYLLRTLINTGETIKSLALSQDSPQNILDTAQKKLYEVSVDNTDKNFVALPEVLTETFERINDLYNNKEKFRGVPTGFDDIDNLLGGFHNSDLIILAARPSMGKTSLALELIKRIALGQKVGTAIFSLEMSRDQLVDKLVASVSGISLRNIRTGHLSDEPNNNEFMRLGTAIGQLNEAPVWIDDAGSLTIMELRTKARRLKSKHNIGLIIIDYLQLMSGNSTGYSGNRVQEVSDISRGLKMLAKELNIPILALSQLSRSVEGRDDKRPMLSDLRESGSIEQDADIVMFIHREEQYHKETKKKGIADILISKHRNGATGTVELAWIHRLATFDNLHGARVSGRVNE